MRTTRATRAALLLVLSLTLSWTTGSPAAAATGPSTTAVEISQVRITCAGDTVSGTVRVQAASPVHVLAVLHVQYTSGAWQRTERSTTFAAPAGSREYAFSLDTLGLPSSVTDYRVHLSAGTGEATSHAAPVRRCAPAAVVPEVPAAVLVPLSLALSGSLVLVVRRRRDAR